MTPPACSRSIRSSMDWPLFMTLQNRGLRGCHGWEYVPSDIFAARFGVRRCCAAFGGSVQTFIQVLGNVYVGSGSVLSRRNTLLFYPWNPRHPVVVCKFFIFLRTSPQEIRRDSEGGIDKLGDSFTKRGITNVPPESRGFAFASRFLVCKWLSVRFAIYLTNKIEELVAIQ